MAGVTSLNSGLQLIYEIRKARIGALELDASIREEHTNESEATSNPVEDGAEVTDHIIPKPDQVTVTGVFTNAPLSQAERDTSLLSVARGDRGRAETAYDELLRLRDLRVPVTVQTTLRNYESMALVALRVPREAKVGDCVEFTATFRHIEIVKNETREVAADIPAAKGVSDGGLKSKKDAPASVETRRTSLLKQGANFLKRRFSGGS